MLTFCLKIFSILLHFSIAADGFSDDHLYIQAMARGRRTVLEKSEMTRNQKIRWVMRKAWQIAKAAVPIHGGKVREYLGAAIRMAWAMLKAGFNVIPTVSAAVAVYHRDEAQAESAASEASFSSEVAIASDDSDVAVVELIEAPVATVVAKKSTGFVGKIAQAARRAIESFKNLLTCAVHIELAHPQME